MDKLIYDEFCFLEKLYGLKYKFQTFDLQRGWIISAHSFYNDTGCFTIHNMESRGELYFYYSKRFSKNRNKLYEKSINIYSVEKEIWDKYGRFGWIPNIFFWWNNKKILRVSAEVVKAHINKYNKFCGITIVCDSKTTS